jgi:hypothetical protein
VTELGFVAHGAQPVAVSADGLQGRLKDRRRIKDNLSINVERTLLCKSYLEEACRFDSVHAGENEAISEEIFTELEANFAASLLTFPPDYLSLLMYRQW